MPTASVPLGKMTATRSPEVMPNCPKLTGTSSWMNLRSRACVQVGRSGSGERMAADSVIGSRSTRLSCGGRAA